MSPGTISPLTNVKALTFDVFGTVVDWRSSVVEELTLRAHLKLSSPATSSSLSARIQARLSQLTETDWGRFAQEWRDSYYHFTRSFDPGRDEWKSIDDHHRECLLALLDKYDLSGAYSAQEVESLSLVWHRLRPWNDASEGLARLGRRDHEDGSTDHGGFTTAALTNANMALIQDLDDFGNLGFHRLFSAEQFGAYKPNPATYLGAVRELGLEPQQVAMVAAHIGDLKAAREQGLRTVYVAREGEEQEKGGRVEDARDWVDLWIEEEEEGFVTLAERLGSLLT